MPARTATLAMLSFATLCAFGVAHAQTVPDASTSRRRSVVQRQHCLGGAVVAQRDVIDVVADASHVFYGDFNGELRRIAKNGGEPERLVSMPGTWITFLELDDTDVYFQSRNLATDTDSVYVTPKGGGGATPLLTGIQYMWDMLPEDGWLYLQTTGPPEMSSWPANGRIVRMKKDGSVVETLVTGLRGSMGMKVDDRYVYYSEAGESPFDPAGGVRRVLKSGGAAETLAVLPGAWSMAQDDESLFVLSVSQGERNAFIDSVSKSDGSVKTLVTGISFEMFEPMEVWNQSLYFMNLTATTTARIEAVPVAGGERRTFPDYSWGFRLFGVDACGVYMITPASIERGLH